MKIVALSFVIYIKIVVLSQAVSVAEKKNLSDTLFGVRLGGVYKIDGKNSRKDVETLPIKKFTGLQKFLGNGIWYYFEPLKEYNPFRYIEIREDPNDKYFKTSFSLYLLPVIPKSVTNLKKLKMYTDKNMMDIDWEVAKIIWTENDEEGDRPYYWAIEMCKNVEVNLGIKPKIFNLFEQKSYFCSFESDLRELKIESLKHVKSFSLAYSDAKFEQKNNALDSLLRKLKMNKIRPY